MYNVLQVWINWQITIMMMITVFTIVGDQVPGLVHPRQVLSQSALFPAPRQFIKYVNINVFCHQLWMYRCFHSFRALTYNLIIKSMFVKEHYPLLHFILWLLVSIAYICLFNNFQTIVNVVFVLFMHTSIVCISSFSSIDFFYIFLLKQFLWFQLIQIIL